VPDSSQSLDEIKERIHSYGPRKLAAWLVSNCVTQGRREDLVKELSRFIDIDTYGACGDRNCTGRMSEECYKYLEKNYMFYLAFENSICEDYVTEKFFNAARYDFIPVIFGGANYSKFAPHEHKIYIDALSYPSPESLAKDLIRIANDPELYFSYFEWKKSFSVISPYNWHCDLCEKLHFESGIFSEPQKNLYKWWYTDADCQWWPLRSRGHRPWEWN
jgi:alpha-1,3-fucosyltransferase